MLAIRVWTGHIEQARWLAGIKLKRSSKCLLTGMLGGQLLADLGQITCETCNLLTTDARHTILLSSQANPPYGEKR
ncbi:hypothetical protein RALTA_B0265 [Cupriavidus taiwanensis LMG 19424]|uniref:Uncharacterized protein n=1 Tax=Cupriavidus taiwanensis (strain DSM 17343 / BCRC 17206 / CCUG 44338 / CIP 107171 / LMG 19424 / R1) TaxID=977880 RepID=B2AI64_CUPTR|nr:hypothetical protein RALTA_B0265 [Cupriavidus taiwanensis LMG 19424]